MQRMEILKHAIHTITLITWKKYPFFLSISYDALVIFPYSRPPIIFILN